MKIAFGASFALAVLLAIWCATGIRWSSAPPASPYYEATIKAAEYRSLPHCGQRGQPNTPNPCADENVLLVLDRADETALSFQLLVVQISRDPDVTPEARRAAAVWAGHSAQAFKETVNAITKIKSP